MEPFLLADFVRPRSGDRVLDVGTGCGVIPLLLRTRVSGLFITAVELQTDLVGQAKENFKRNAASDIRLVHSDFLDWARKGEPETFDWLVSNPPYRKAQSGRINPDREKALARHEIALTLRDLVQAGARQLVPGGHMALAYPMERYSEVAAALKENGLPVSRIRKVYGYRGRPARFFLIEGKNSPGNASPVEDELFIYEKDGAYTAAMQAIYASFDYPGGSHRHREK